MHVCGLEVAHALGERDKAPVGDAADDTAVGEDEGAGGFGDSGGVSIGREVRVGMSEWWMAGCGGSSLFHLAEVARPDLLAVRYALSEE